MATLKALSGTNSWSLSQGFKDYFYCCFATRGAGTKSRSEQHLGMDHGDDCGYDDGESFKGSASDISRHTPEGGEVQPVRKEDQDYKSISSKHSSKHSRRSSRHSEFSIIEMPQQQQQQQINSANALRKSLDSLLIQANEAGKSTASVHCDEFCDSALDSSLQSHNVKGDQSSDCAHSHSSAGENAEEGHPVAEDIPADTSFEVNHGFERTEDDHDADAYPGGPNNKPLKSSHPSLVVELPTSAAETDGAEFDISDLQEKETSNTISQCGSLRVTFKYDAKSQKVLVTMHEAQEIPSQERGGASHTQIRMLLLPTKKVRQKTKVKAGENPKFEETFDFKVPSEELCNMGLRVRLYGCERLRRERMIGECIVSFASVNMTGIPLWLALEPRSNLSHGDSSSDVASLTHSDSGSSTHSLQHGGMPELMLGLSYNGVTGRLSVEVIKGSNFKNMAMNRPPDTYVKLTLMAPNGQEMSRSKTSIRRGQPNPLFKETFMFQVAQFQLADVSLLVSVFAQKSLKRKEMIGWFTLGQTNSSDEDLAHWTAMLESKGEQVCRWHVLLEP